MAPQELLARPVAIIVEDDINVARMLERHLQRGGMDVRTTHTIAAARELLASETEWDVVVLDRNLPDGDGISLAAEVRRLKPHGYIIVLTGESSEEAKLEGFSHGADDYVTKPFQMTEFVARVSAGIRIVKLQKDLLESNRRLEELSLTDGLTQLRNRRAFEQDLVSAFKHSRRYNRPLSLAILDVDHFKRINDTHGHAAGDTVLRDVARIVESVTRRSDLVARVGGEEFAVLLPETPLFEAVQVAEKIRASVAAAISYAGDQVTVSLGLASIPHSAVTDTLALYRAADSALYRAKRSGRNRVEIERRRSEMGREAEAQVCAVG